VNPSPPPALAEELPPLRRGPREWARTLGLAFAVVIVDGGLACTAGWLTAFAGAPQISWHVAIVVFIVLCVHAAITHGRHTRASFEILTLVGLIAWGLALNHWLKADCVRQCSDSNDDFRFLAEPYVFGTLSLHVLSVLAYAVSRRRPEALHAPVELLVHAALLAGIVLHLVVGAQFGWYIAFSFLAPITMPVLAPPMTIVLYAIELIARLRRRGAEAATRIPPPPPYVALPYREGPVVPEPPAPPQVHVPALLRALAASPIFLGVHAVVVAAVYRDWSAELRTFTDTCGHTLSRIPITEMQRDCHYLCTVAARGHARLVRPERLGQRRGQIIVVNRQLAIANAFEDLLHTRWPRFGRAARQLYDRVGLPVSRWIRGRWMADAIYVAMKPAEWIFYLALVLLDPRSPEERIARMYR
jgi:hypothetical protein